MDEGHSAFRISSVTSPNNSSIVGLQNALDISSRIDRS